MSALFLYCIKKEFYMVTKEEVDNAFEVYERMITRAPACV